MRTFRQLTQTEVSAIILAHTEGATNALLAEEYDVDPSTISYHVKKYERSYPEQGGIYATLKIQVRKTCIHPSSRCTICTEMMDHLLREERELIRTLRVRLEDAHSRLRVAGLFVE
jgi:IS30 family transposase